MRAALCTTAEADDGRAATAEAEAREDDEERVAGRVKEI